MADDLLTCPLCGFEFAPADTACHHGCPLKTACNLTRCPLCEYEFPATPKSVSWLQNLFRRRQRVRRPEPATAGGETCPDRGGRVSTVREMSGGEQAEVMHLETGDADRSNALAVFGLTPGSEVTLVQRHPSYVLQVGETLLALDADVADTIVVRRAERAA